MFKKVSLNENLEEIVLYFEDDETNSKSCNDTGACDNEVNVGC